MPVDEDRKLALETEVGADDRAFGRLLKFWRGVHRVSQESLALSLDSSTRHISFLENGKSYPSKEMVEKIANVLSLGSRDTSQLSISAGYVPPAKPVDFQSEELKWLRKAMLLTLRSLDPYPATLVDSAGDILMVNKAWVRFFQDYSYEGGIDKVTNHYDFVFNKQDSDNILSFGEDALAVIMMSLQQAALISDDPGCFKMLERLGAHSSVPKDWKQRAAKIEPMTSFRVRATMNGKLCQFYQVSQNVGAMGPVAYVSEPRLAINTLYPEDDDVEMPCIDDLHLKHPLLFY